MPARVISKPAFVQVMDPFAYQGDVYRRGMIFESTDPVVKSHPTLFKPVEVYSTKNGSPRIEQATAAPGEVRGE